MNEAMQLPLFPDDLHGKVYPRDDGTWEARINGGWWVAIGETKEQAIKKVVKRYNDEREKYDC